MNATTRHTRLAAIMFTDMKGYSALMGRDEKAALALLDEHNALVIPCVTSHGGRVVKTIGDAVMAEFPSTLGAVQCAVEAQRLLHERNALDPSATPILVRMGIHAGEVWDVGGDLFGDGVNIAARLEPQAPVGGICLSGEAWQQVRTKLELRAETVPDAKLKNIERNVEVMRLVLPWTPVSMPESSPVAMTVAAPASVPARPAVTAEGVAEAATFVAGGVTSLAARAAGVALMGFGFFVTLGMVLALSKKGFEAPLVIILGFLGVGPAWLGRRLFKGKPAPALPAPDVRQQLLRAAAQEGGELTLAHAATHVSVAAPELRAALTALEVDGFAESVVREDGVVVWRFKDFKKLKA